MICVCQVYLHRFWMWGSAGKSHLAARQSCPRQRKSLVWGHSYKPHPQAAPGWADGLSSPSLLNHPPGDGERGFLGQQPLWCYRWSWLCPSCTHPDVFTTEDVEGNRVPLNIGTSVSENENDAVLLPHQLDCVGQSKLKGLACVCGLSQPTHVSHCPVHTHGQTHCNYFFKKINDI